MGKRFRWFIKEWIGKVNKAYKNEELGYLIYDCCRCGIVHNAILKNHFHVSSYLYRGKHLHLSKGKEFIYFDSKKFADDFIEAQRRFRENLQDQENEYIQKINKNLDEMINNNKESSKDNFNEIINNGSLEICEYYLSEVETTITRPPETLGIKE
ncbi:MAG: hypothetical protein ACMUJM_24470 [bacterium]